MDWDERIATDAARRYAFAPHGAMRGTVASVARPVLQESPRRRSWSRVTVVPVTFADVCLAVIAVVLVWAKIKGWG